MDGYFVSEHAHSVDEHRFLDFPSQSGRSRREVALAATKQTFCAVVFLSSLGLWAAIWVAAASLAAAWLR